MKTPSCELGSAVRVFLKDGGHFVGIIVQGQYNSAQGSHRYKIKSDEVPDGYIHVWDYELSPLFATGWANIVDAVIDEMVAL